MQIPEGEAPQGATLELGTILTLGGLTPVDAEHNAWHVVDTLYILVRCLDESLWCVSLPGLCAKHCE